MSSKNPPNPKQTRSLIAWAEQLYEYLSSDAERTNRQDPRPILLNHRAKNVMERAGVGGVLLYDPTYDTPVVSVGNEWVPLNIRVGIELAYETAFNVDGAVIAVGGAIVPFNADNVNRAPWVTFNAGGSFTLYRGMYQLNGGVSIITTSGINKVATGYIAATSDLTTPVGSARLFTIRTSNADGSAFTSFSGELDVPDGGGTYALVIETEDTDMAYGLAHGIAGYNNTFARLDISLIGLNE